MERAFVESRDGVTLMGGAPVTRAQAAVALALAPRLVAADGGADRALRLGLMPEAVFGDLDSISDQARARLGAPRVHAIPEQETTDFDKALGRIRAPFVLAVGFSGARLDHALAALNTIGRQPPGRCLMISASDVVFLAPQALSLQLPRGTRVSLFPLAPVRGESEGLDWPIHGLHFTPAGRVGTSNRASGGPVSLRFDSAAMLVILPRARLPDVLDGLSLRPPAAPGG